MPSGRLAVEYLAWPSASVVMFLPPSIAKLTLSPFTGFPSLSFTVATIFLLLSSYVAFSFVSSLFTVIFAVFVTGL